MTINTDKPYRIFADAIEQTALEQFESAMQQPFAVRGALMPDAHTGYSLPIGSVIATSGVVVPSWVGYDIGCGMCALVTNHDVGMVQAAATTVFKRIYESVPVGFAHNTEPTQWLGCDELARSAAMDNIFNKNGKLQLGSLGGGNHFIEVGIDGYGRVWIIIHSGSRGIGHAAASHYMRLASGDGKVREGHFGLDCDSPAGRDYIKDLDFCLRFALANRFEIMRRVVRVLDSVAYCTQETDWGPIINRNHNHAEYKNGCWIHRKGATHAEAGMMGVIPGNMRDGSFIVRGKGNHESLCSSSHGAGRVLGRKEAARTLKVDDFERTMSGVVAKVGADTIDESPFVYKDIFDVMRQQSELVDVVAHVKPIINIKG